MNENDNTLIPGNDTPSAAGKSQRIADHERGPRSMSRAIQSAERIQAFAAGAERGTMRAADADRDRVVEFLNAAYSEGRLFKDEYDARLENALSARTYADLDQLVTDLPAAQAAAVAPVVKTTTVVSPVAKINGLAMASLACGIAQFVLGPVATIPAIVLGHVARHQIKRTGEQGAGLALAGLVLGWAAAILGIVLIVLALTVAAGVHGTAGMH